MDTRGGRRCARDQRRQPARVAPPSPFEGASRARALSGPRCGRRPEVSLFTRTPPLACQELVELVTAYFDGTLSGTDRRRFRRHISGCDNCTAYVEQMR